MKPSPHWVIDVTAAVARVSVVFRDETYLWLLAVAFFGIGDLSTTGVAVTAGTVGEANPLVRVLLGTFGIVGFVALKLFAFGISYVAWRVVGRPNNVGVPLALVVLGVCFTAWNLSVVASAFS